MTVLRYSPVGASLAFATFLLASLAPSFAAPAAVAKSAKGKVAAVAASDTDGPAATGSIGAAGEEGGAGCQRSRRKLWVDGEGWIVRRVTVC